MGRSVFPPQIVSMRFHRLAQHSHKTKKKIGQLCSYLEFKEKGKFPKGSKLYSTLSAVAQKNASKTNSLYDKNVTRM